MNIMVFEKGADIFIDEDECVGCRKCVEVCPEDIYELERRPGETDPDRVFKSVAKQPENCILCLSCIEICGKSAIYIDNKQ